MADMLEDSKKNMSAAELAAYEAYMKQGYGHKTALALAMGQKK